MRILINEKSEEFAPPFEVFNGDHEPHADTPDRSRNIKSAIENAGLDTEEASYTESEILNEVLKIHNQDYIDFLRTSSQELEKNNGKYIYPSVFEYNKFSQDRNYEMSAVAKRGQYLFDLYTPVLPGLYDMVLRSSNLALQAAKVVQNSGETAYALCRPSGHHAEPGMAGGYCYINNSAVAANYLSNHGKVVVLDIDFHHGNGTQSIFYGRDDVFTISIHADPTIKFPFFSGGESETGAGKGKGYNKNYPLQLGVNDDQYLEVLDSAITEIKNYNPDYLVIALGVDTHKDDPISGFDLTTEFFRNASERLKSLDLPTAVIQEGGYATGVIGANVVAFLQSMK